ncbi:DUF3888 domain-containing protein [Paenibacillus dokdonensis]|uniref:DUF3888 domain-containing protein n=1 Tax=Paenibacillus dokdonensis TaxID=2567944 RepID=A0ABU6GJR9_9BACL|nr:DUF3888 domain-containing protein [Paenibacillus dokdonensis]MEC0239990.1 DUF3888 domain-containing protein [Paenibacillus dokdonensis]
MRFILIITLVVSMTITQTSFCYAVGEQPKEDSRELQLQDMLVLQLLPYMNEKLAEIYSNVLTVAPGLYPYFVDVKNSERVNGFRGFDFLITLDATPTVGPHIPVGEDVFTYQMSASEVKLKKTEHLRGPNKDDFPPNYKDLLK